MSTLIPITEDLKAIPFSHILIWKPDARLNQKHIYGAKNLKRCTPENCILIMKMMILCVIILNRIREVYTNCL